MNEWDFEPLMSLFGCQPIHLEPGDILFLRPKKPEKEYILQEIRDRMLEVLPRGVKAMFIPSGWEVGVAKSVQDDSIIAGLQEIEENLR